MTKIKFVRLYVWHGCWQADTVYKSGRLVAYVPVEALPKTVKAFIASHTAREQYDKTLQRYEYIYE